MTPGRTAGAGTLLLRDALLADGRRVDVRLRDGLIDTVTAAGTAPAGPADQVEDLAGCLLLPAPAEVHTHLDKALTAEQVPNPGGDLLGAVTAWLRHRPTRDREEIEAAARAALRGYLAHGVTALRSHVDLGDDIGLRALHALLAVRESEAARCDVQLVAFAATPLTGPAGARNRELLAQALAAGADAVGACPGLDPDPAACVDLCLELAAAHGVGVDLHVDEWLDPEPCSLELLADAVVATGFAHPVVAGHCVSLGMMDPARAAYLADRVAQAGIAVACLPQTNLYLQGRDHDRAVPRGLTALGALRAAGVTVAAGGDNLQDPFNILGRGDPLETAALLVLAGHDDPATAYDAVSARARQAMGLPPVAVAPGAPAELLAIRAATVREAVATATAERLVVHAGRVVARTAVHRHFPDEKEMGRTG
jgi:cytosine deaminase